MNLPMKVLIEKVSTYLVDLYRAVSTAMYFVMAEKRGLDLRELRVTTANDLLAWSMPSLQITLLLPFKNVVCHASVDTKEEAAWEILRLFVFRYSRTAFVAASGSIFPGSSGEVRPAFTSFPLQAVSVDLCKPVDFPNMLRYP